MDTRNLLKHESSRMEAFRLLSECYFLPDPQVPEKLDILEHHIATVCDPALGFIRKMRAAFEGAADVEPLKVDFAKLFVGPYKLFAAPYGSVYLDDERKLMGDSTLDVKSSYRKAGLDTANSFKDAPDHIAAELEFMYYLIFKEVEAFSTAASEVAIDFVQKQKSFLEDHLVAWVPQFTANIIEHAETSFYRNLAIATEAFLKKNWEIVCAFLDSKTLNSKKPVEINSFRV